MKPLRAWAPLLGFMAVTAVVLVWLEATGAVLLTSLAPLVLAAIVVPLAYAVHVYGRQNLGRVRGLVVVLLRLTLLTLLVLALAEPRSVRTDERLSVVFAVDHSASIENSATDAALGFVLSSVSEKPEQDEVGLVFFGRNAGVELPPAASLPYESINVDIDREGTDLAEALTVSAALIPPDRLGRIVLISDGVANEGRLSEALDELASRGIAVDVVPIDYTTPNEVWLEKLELPRAVKLGDTIEPSVVLSSLSAGEGTLILERDGTEIASQRVQFKAGKNRYSIPLLVPAPGYYEYVARIRIDDGKDRWPQNNVAMASFYLQGKGRVLVVIDGERSTNEHEDFVTALRAQKREVDIITGTELATDPLALQPADCIVFVDVPRDAFDERQLEAVHAAVFDQGSGFLMIGGEGSFGPGGYRRTRIEDLLPVSMDMSQRKVLPKGALAIILHTCEFANGNTWAKRITLQAMKVLDAKDEVGVLAYDYMGQDKWLFELSPAGDFDRLAPIVNGAQIGDMPGFAPTMQLALAGLKASDAATRHMIIISDGDPSPAPPSLLQQLIANKISVSTVTVFPHGQTSNIMQQMAKATGGRHYQPQRPGNLPGIFIKEAKTLRRSAIQNKTFTPTVTADSAILKGIRALPELHGYVLTMPKPRSTTILEGPDEESPDPVLARWNYGVGATAAFTSDLTRRWGRDWVSWDKYRAFVHQLTLDIARAGRKERFRVQSYALRGQGVVLAEDQDPDGELTDLVAAIEGPSGTRHAKLEQIAPRRYEARFPLDGVGRYRAVVTSTQDPAQRMHVGFAVPFSQEYLRFRSDHVALDAITKATGGRKLSAGDAGAKVFEHHKLPPQASRSIVPLLLALLALLLPLEVAARRLELIGLIKRPVAEPASESLQALMARKQAVARELDRPREPVAGERDSARAPSAPRKEDRPAAAKPAGHATEPESRSDSTLGRLLEKKRRAQNPNKDDERS